MFFFGNHLVFSNSPVKLFCPIFIQFFALVIVPSHAGRAEYTAPDFQCCQRKILLWEWTPILC